jgi:hypothetical protein
VNRTCRSSQLSLIVLVTVLMFSALAFGEGTWIVTDKGAKVWDPFPDPNESATWSSGTDANSYATGQGVLQWFVNGKPAGKYEGTMSKGKENGKGIYTDANGTRYDGDFVDGKMTGKCIRTYGPNSPFAGDRYEGDSVDGKITGKGVYAFANGDRYEGDFVDDRMSGYGTFYYKNGTVQRGRWSGNKFLGP